jgi:hypothetical protein
MAKIRLSLPQLQGILDVAKAEYAKDDSLSRVVSLEVTEESELTGRGDSVKAEMESGYAERVSTLLGVF